MSQKSPTSFLNKIADYDNFIDIDISFSPKIGAVLSLGDDCDNPHQFGLSSTTKRIQKLQNTKRNYQNTTNELRLALIDAVRNRGEKIKHVAKRLGINYSSAKAICQVYKKEGRVNKIMLKRKVVKEQLTPLTSISEAYQEINSRPSEKEPLDNPDSSQISQTKNSDLNIDQIGIVPKITNQNVLQNTPYELNQPSYANSNNLMPNKCLVYYVPAGTFIQPSISPMVSTQQIPNYFLNSTQFFQIQPLNTPFSQNFQQGLPIQITNDTQYNAFLTNNSSNKINDSNNQISTNLSSQNIPDAFQPQQLPHNHNYQHNSGNELNYQNNIQRMHPAIYAIHPSSSNLPLQEFYKTNPSAQINHQQNQNIAQSQLLRAQYTRNGT